MIWPVVGTVNVVVWVDDIAAQVFVDDLVEELLAVAQLPIAEEHHEEWSELKNSQTYAIQFMANDCA